MTEDDYNDRFGFDFNDRDFDDEYDPLWDGPSSPCDCDDCCTTHDGTPDCTCDDCAPPEVLDSEHDECPCDWCQGFKVSDDEDNEEDEEDTPPTTS